jgi:DNA-directed RNA polymerase subunit beta
LITEAGVDSLDVLDIDTSMSAAYMRNTLAADKNDTREQALIDIYRVMRPGEPPTPETAEALFNSGCSSILSATTCRPSAG